MIEHLYTDDLSRFLLECYRVLKPGGTLRLAVPSLTNAIEAYTSGKHGWFGDWPHSLESLGGRFANFIFCDGQHRNAFDFGYLCELLTGFGFVDVEEFVPLASRIYSPEQLRANEGGQPTPPHILCVEARK
jgi:hypothetical protein